jgi:WD40 repeat protein
MPGSAFFFHSQDTCAGHTVQVLSVRFSPDGGRLVSGSAAETVRIWERSSGRGVATLRAEELYVGTHISGVRGLAPAPRRACGCWPDGDR